MNHTELRKMFPQKIKKFICSKKFRNIMLAVYLITTIFFAGSMACTYFIGPSTFCSYLGMTSCVIWAICAVIMLNYHDLKNVILDSYLETHV